MRTSLQGPSAYFLCGPPSAACVIITKNCSFEIVIRRICIYCIHQHGNRDLKKNGESFVRLFVALRLFSENHARLGIEANLKNHGPRGKLIDIHIERFHPALKNIIEHLRTHGKLPATRQGNILRTVDGQKTIERTEDCRLYWCEVETDLDLPHWEALAEVEAVIRKDDFTKFAQSIRCRAGAAYITACEEYAQHLPVKTSQPINYEPPRRPTDRAA